MTDREPTPPTEAELAEWKRDADRSIEWNDGHHGPSAGIIQRLIHALEQARSELEKWKAQARLRLGYIALEEIERLTRERDDLRVESGALLEALKRTEQERDDLRQILRCDCGNQVVVKRDCGICGNDE